MSTSVEKAKRTIDAMFQDASVLQSETRANLHNIIEHCEVLIETLDDELE